MDISSLLLLVGIVLLFAAVFVSVGVIVFLGVRSRRRKFDRITEAMHGVASQMGWQFSRDIPWASIPGANYFHLFTQGIGRRVYNQIQGEAEGVGISVFQYSFAAKATAAQTQQIQTVALLQSNKLNLPALFLRPASIKHQLGTAFSATINFPAHSDFSNQYLLSGNDEGALRSLFNDSVLAFFAANPGWNVEAGGSELFLYQENRVMPPEYVPTLVNEGLRVLTLLRGEGARSH